MCLQGMQGPQPLTYQEIESWSRVSRIEIEGHEAETLKRLSEIYCNEWYLSCNPSAPDPDGQKQDVSEQFGKLLERFK